MVSDCVKTLHIPSNQILILFLLVKTYIHVQEQAKKIHLHCQIFIRVTRTG